MEYYSRSDDLERYYYLPYLPSKSSSCYISTENSGNVPYHNFNNGQYPCYGPYMWVPVVVQPDAYPAEKSMFPSYPDNSSEAFVSNRTISSLTNYQSTVVPSSNYHSNSSCNELIPATSFEYSENEEDSYSTPLSKDDSYVSLHEVEKSLSKENYEGKNSNFMLYGSSANHHKMKNVDLSSLGGTSVSCNLDSCFDDSCYFKRNLIESTSTSVHPISGECHAASQNAATEMESVQNKPKLAIDSKVGCSEFITPTKNKSKMMRHGMSLTDVIKNEEQDSSRTLFSFGTKFHSRGTCNPCWFEWSRGCHMGVHCRFCHDASHTPAGASRVIPSGEALAKSSVSPELILKDSSNKNNRFMRSTRKKLKNSQDV
ncbi:hypothetical protein IE077_004085 [Cardiosporidium cionae]|uniref:C3H1-type domain-containing protein n=1 Tax=Cardiosporidium cionae TaxID=476202 RepID=A0ABQ7J6T7_9APIC|nr:hypothetical protein IE077_004085 [Cardiosporidium cionae]|eukprot:KAF8819702.1 hypothetical protein IE077_004085 [Cardiosporidium cionae]